MGFNFYVNDGQFSYRLALTDALIQVGGQFYSLNATSYHDYRLEMRPGGEFDLYIDGSFFVTGVGAASRTGNTVFFGDSTGHENTDAEITAFSFEVGSD